MSFLVYDLTLLILFIIFLSVFLYIRRKKIQKEGLLHLYRTKWGIKLINYIGKRYKRTIKFLSYVSIIVGYALMAGIIYLAARIVWLYIFHPEIVRAIKVPPVMPLVPYLPQAFNISFLPNFYFVSWIIIIAIIAITHEMAHGIVAAYNKIKIKSTGFGFFPFFLPIFLAAFVEPDEEKMAKKSKVKQMAMLSAGTFANIITGILFFGLMWIFFSLAFVPAGVVFDTYSYSVVNVSEIDSINGICFATYEEAVMLVPEEGYVSVKTDKAAYLIDKKLIENEDNAILFKEGILVLYDDAPAIRGGMTGAISEINGVKIDSISKLSEEMDNYSPGDEITIQTINNDSKKDYKIVLAENPEDKNDAWLGIGFFKNEKSGIIGNVVTLLSSFKDPHVIYEPKFGELSQFIYNLFWWLVLICFSVALVNMLPVGIFDGGRFFYLTILAITRKEEIAKKTFKYLTWFFLFILALLMILWVKSFIIR